MNIEKLILAMNDIALLRDVSLKELQQTVEAYPFFSLGQMLLVKKMQQSKHLLLKKEIKKTAVLVPNRKLLYTFLYQKEIQAQVQKTESHVSANTENFKIEEQKEKATKVEPAQPQEAEETTSSFKVPVNIPSKKVSKKTSTFTKAIDLKSLGDKKKQELDILEQQIIGQTIEHVLSQEIAEQTPIVRSSKKKVTENQKKPAVSSKQKFGDWLAILDNDRLKARRKNDAEKEDQSSTNEISESDIINSFLSKNTNIITPADSESEFTPSNLARLSIVEDEDFVTETLADIYAKQGNINKAIKAYQKLLLKYPEKKTYFAARIEKLEQDLK